MSVLALFCHVDDFCNAFLPQWERQQLWSGVRQRRRASRLCPSEIMTLLIHFQQMRFRDFKTYYTRYVAVYLRAEFPGLVSYQRFVELIPSVLVPLGAYLQSCLGRCTGLSFIDSTALAVCHNRRISSHRVFRGLAARGKTSVDWFYGFKLHLVINEQGALLSWRLTSGNVDDRVPVPTLTAHLQGKLFGDKGYLSQPLTERLRAHGLSLITKLRARMKARLLPLEDALLLRKRGLIDAVIDQLKNACQIEHSRHRSASGFLANLLAGLIAYCLSPAKPALRPNPLTLPIPN